MTKYKYYIGIDPGSQTGVAIWDATQKKFQAVTTYKIHEAFGFLQSIHGLEHGDYLIRVEDARKRKWFGKSGREVLQGAGSIKRDCQIIEDFLIDMEVPFELVAPKNNKTKLTQEAFKALTRWQGRTNEHSRDAGMLVFGL